MRVSNALWMSLAVSSLFAGVISCSDPAEKAGETASACGKRSCPAGTRPEETRMLDASNDISGGYDPATYKAEGAYKRSGSGSCEYACVVTQACPDNTFPVISDTCFTCGAISDEGDVDQGVCSDEAVVATECGKQQCPIGTLLTDERSLQESSGYDVSQGFDPDTYDPDLVPYMTFGEGKCKFQCTPHQNCPENYFPVITADCFTCAAIIGDHIERASCEFDGGNNSGGSGGSSSGGKPASEAGAPAASEGGAGGSEG